MLLNNLDRVLTDLSGNNLLEQLGEGQSQDLTLRHLLRNTLLQDEQTKDNRAVRIERYQLAKHIMTAGTSVELSTTQVEMILNRMEKWVNTLALGIVQEILKPDNSKLN
jgi:hypothetical protein